MYRNATGADPCLDRLPAMPILKFRPRGWVSRSQNQSSKGLSPFLDGTSPSLDASHGGSASKPPALLGLTPHRLPASPLVLALSVALRGLPWLIQKGTLATDEHGRPRMNSQAGPRIGATLRQREIEFLGPALRLVAAPFRGPPWPSVADSKKDVGHGRTRKATDERRWVEGTCRPQPPKVGCLVWNAVARWYALATERSLASSNSPPRKVIETGVPSGRNPLGRITAG